MALTRAGERATESHRRDQVSLRARMLVEVIREWRVLDPYRLDETGPTWMRLVMSIVGAYREQSSQRAWQYYEQFREFELPRQVPLPRQPWPEWDRTATETSLLVKGPIGIKHRTGQGIDPVRASRVALVEVQGAATRHALAGGRSVLDDAVSRDPVALGWARVTSASPCSFCAMLASRGPVYKSRRSASTASDGARYHDGCACTTEPVFSRSQPWPGRARDWSALWAESTRGRSGVDARRAFRAAVEGRSIPVSTGPARSRRSPTERVDPPQVSDKQVQRRSLEAQISALSRTFADLERRRTAGEDVAAPYAWQQRRLADLREQLAAL